MQQIETIQALVHDLDSNGARPCLLATHQQGIATWSYAEVADLARRLAGGLQQAGIGPGDYVPVLAKNRPEWIFACLGVLGAGAAVVPLETQIATEALGTVLRDSGARLLFTTADYLPRLAQCQPTPPVRPILLDAADEDQRGWRALLAADSAPDLPTVAPDAPAALFYTSGTTGTPKGVPLTQANLAFQLQSVLQTQLASAGDRVVVPLPLYHVYPFTIGLLVPLAFRVPLVLPQSIAGPHILRAIQAGGGTVLVAVPRIYRALAERIDGQVAARGPAAQRLFRASLALSTWLRRRLNLQAGRWLFGGVHTQVGPHLRLLCCGGAALDTDLAWRLEALGWRLAIGYGLTETAPLLTMNLPGAGVPNLASVGLPLAGVDLRLAPLAPDESGPDESRPRDGPQGPETSGEILARGPSVFAGYRNLPEQTAAAFTRDGWFRTGDLGYQDAAGHIYISGRASTQIVTEGGKNVQPEPVEEHYQQHPVIAEIGVLEQAGRLVAIVVPDMEAVAQQHGGDVAGAVRAALRQQSPQLASYQRVGSYVLTNEPLPRTNLGKLRRHLLAGRYDQAQRAG